MYSYGPPHMAGQKQNDQLEPTFRSYVRIRDVALKTYQSRWTIGRSGERGSGISVLAARHDDDDNINLIVIWHIDHCRLFNGKSILYIGTVLFQKIQFNISPQLNVKSVLFQAIKFSISTQFNSIWPIDSTLSGATNPDQSGPGSDSNGRVLRITQSSWCNGYRRRI